MNHDLSVIAGNLLAQARNVKPALIGGGYFHPTELVEAARALKLFPELVAVLSEIVGQAAPNRWGYDAAGVALDDAWRARARDVLSRVP